VDKDHYKAVTQYVFQSGVPSVGSKIRLSIRKQILCQFVWKNGAQIVGLALYKVFVDIFFFQMVFMV
jgi:hypothetical protein